MLDDEKIKSVLDQILKLNTTYLYQNLCPFCLVYEGKAHFETCAVSLARELQDDR